MLYFLQALIYCAMNEWQWMLMPTLGFPECAEHIHQLLFNQEGYGIFFCLSFSFMVLFFVFFLC